MAPDTNIALLVSSTLLVLSYCADTADTALRDIETLNRNVVQLYDVVQKKVRCH